MKRIIFIFAVICLLSTSVQTFAEEATIVDKKGVKVELTSVETETIDFQIGDFYLTVPVATISTIRLAEDGKTLILRTVTEREVKGASDSKLEGAWELGQYSVALSDIKSVDFAVQPQQETTVADQPDGFVAICTNRTGALVDIVVTTLSNRPRQMD